MSDIKRDAVTPPGGDVQPPATETESLPEAPRRPPAQSRVLTREEEQAIYNRHSGIGISPIPSATIVGTGGTGTWVAILLAMSGTTQLYVMDEDYLEISNLNRLPYTIDDIGKPKSEILKEFITAMRPTTSVITMPRVTNLNLHLIKTTHIFDCTDRHPTQLMLSKFARDNNLKYCRVGYDGTHITVTDSVPEWNVGTDESGYTITPSWVVPSVLAACMGLTKTMYNNTLEVSHFLDDCFPRKAATINSKVKNILDTSYQDIMTAKFSKNRSDINGNEICKRCGKKLIDHAEYIWCKGQERSV